MGKGLEQARGISDTLTQGPYPASAKCLMMAAHLIIKVAENT